MRNVLKLKDDNTGEWVGVPAITGESAYQVAVRNGFTGSEEEWLASLKGRDADGGAGTCLARFAFNADISSKPTGGTCDKTYQEISDAYQEGRLCAAVVNDGTSSEEFAVLTKMRADYITFGFIKNRTYSYEVRLYGDDSVSVDFRQLMDSSQGVDKAQRLATARNIQTDLSSDAAIEFDGSEDVQPGITGILDILHGGTSANNAAAALWSLMNGSPDATATEINENCVIPIGSVSRESGRKTTIAAIRPFFKGDTGATGPAGPQGPKGDPPTSFPASGITGTVSIQKGGTGSTTAASALWALINGSNTLTSSSIATGDYIPVGDTSASLGKRISMTELISYFKAQMETSTTDSGIVVGTYVGKTSYMDDSSESQTITLGFRPKFVFVVAIGAVAPVSLSFANSRTIIRNHCYFGATIDGYADSLVYSVLQMVSSGFRVNNSAKDYSDEWKEKRLNYINETYVYLAVK